MKSITIRDVPLETRDELAARAARSGRSLQEYLLSHLIEMARHPDPEDLLARIRQRKRFAAARPSGERILAHREADRQ